MPGVSFTKKRIMNLDQNLRIEEIKTVLEGFGYEGHYPSGGSSHITFRKDKRTPITIPVHGVISKVYVKMVRDAIEIELKKEGENNE